MPKKNIKKSTFPKRFYEQDSGHENKTFSFVLDKDASQVDQFKVHLLSMLNKDLDYLKNDMSECELAERIEIDKSDLSRIRKYRYRYFASDKILRLFEKILILTSFEKKSQKHQFEAEIFFQKYGS
ncbi:MAG: hypothetical protein ACPGJV_13535 [Bacteriovoracaceae bacterium]